MKTLIKRLVVKDPQSQWLGKRVDVLLQDGHIARIAEEILPEQDDYEIVDADGRWMVPGLTDIAVQGGEPGFESRETVKSLLKSAASGGFTSIFTFPNYKPATHSVSEVEFLKKRAESQVCELHVHGAISQNCEGVDIAEMLDMHSAGVRTFTDGKYSIQHGGLLLRALLYTKSFDGLVLNQSMDASIFPKGHMHEGMVSTRMGTRGIPSIAETIMLQRDLDLLAYADSSMHVLFVSTAEGVDLIRQAKKRGLRVSASVSIWNLIYTDEQLERFDSNFKLNPPLRSEQDRQALIAGLKDGTIDCISSGHTPLDIEQKELEFPFATPGAISLQTAFALSIDKLQSEFAPEDIIHLWSRGTKHVSGRKVGVIKEGTEADFFVFDPENTWTYNSDTNHSLSANSPLWSQSIKGKVQYVFRNRYKAYF